MSRENRQNLKHEREERDRFGIGLLLYILVVIAGLVCLLYFLTH